MSFSGSISALKGPKKKIVSCHMENRPKTTKKIEKKFLVEKQKFEGGGVTVERSKFLKFFQDFEYSETHKCKKNFNSIFRQFGP